MRKIEYNSALEPFAAEEGHKPCGAQQHLQGEASEQRLAAAGACGRSGGSEPAAAAVHRAAGVAAALGAVFTRRAGLARAARAVRRLLRRS